MLKELLRRQNDANRLYLFRKPYLMIDYRTIPEKTVQSYFEKVMDDDSAILLASAYASAAKLARNKTYTAKLGLRHYLFDELVKRAPKNFLKVRLLTMCDLLDGNLKELHAYDRQQNAQLQVTATQFSRNAQLLLYDTQNQVVSLKIKDLPTASPEQLFTSLVNKMTKAGLATAKNRGTYAIISQNDKGQIAIKTNIADYQEKLPSNHDGYVSGQPSILGKSTYALFKKIKVDKNSIQSKDQTSLISRVAFVPLIEIGETHHFEALGSERSYQNYATLINSYTAGLMAGLENGGHRSWISGQATFDKEAFLAGLSVSDPQTYQNVKLLAQGFVLASWSQVDSANFLRLLTVATGHWVFNHDTEKGSILDFKKLYQTRLDHGLYQLLDQTKLKSVSPNLELGREYKITMSNLNTMQAHKGAIEKHALTYESLMRLAELSQRLEKTLATVSDNPSFTLANIMKPATTRKKLEATAFPSHQSSETEIGIDDQLAR